jgi:hypothetical protein
MGCCQSKGTKTTAWCKELTVLASGTPCEYALSTSLLPSYVSMDIPLISRQLLLFILRHGWIESALIGSCKLIFVDNIERIRSMHMMLLGKRGEGKTILFLIISLSFC